VHESPHGTVYVGAVPEALEDRLAELYESTYSLPAYFDSFFPPRPRCAWHFSDPPHVIEFQVDGSTAVVLNGVFHVDAESLRKFCLAVFAAMPGIDRIRFGNLACDPVGLGLSFRTDRMVSDFVLRLPATRDEYLGSLGRSTRQNLPRYVRRIEREHPGYRFDMCERGDIEESLVEGIIGLNRLHWSARGGVSGIDELYERRLQRLVRVCGIVGVLRFGDTLIAGWLVTRVGGHAFFHVTGYRDEYGDLHPGLVNSYLTISSCMDRGIQTVHFLWGDADYKRRLGGEPYDLYFATVFRNAGTRYRHPREEVAFRLARARASRSPLVVLPRRVRQKAKGLLRDRVAQWCSSSKA
jgi:hypothetical protein